MVTQDVQGLLNLGHQSIGGLNQIQQLTIVHLQKHTGDLAGLLGLVLVDQRIQSLTDHVLLSSGVGRGQHGIREVHVSGLLSSLLHLLLRHGLTLLHGHALVAHLVGELDARVDTAAVSQLLLLLGSHHLRRVAHRLRGSLAVGAHLLGHTGNRAATGHSLHGDTLRGALGSAHTHVRGGSAALRRHTARLLLDVLGSSGDATAGHNGSATTLREGTGGGTRALHVGARVGEARARGALREGSGGAARSSASRSAAAHGLSGVGEGNTSGLGSTGEARLARLHVHAHAEGLHGSSALHTAGALGEAVLGVVGGSQVGTSVLLALVQSHHQGLAGQSLAVHLADGTGGLLSGRVADEAEALGDGGILLILHDAGRGDGTEGGEGLSEGVIGDGVSDVLHVDVHALELLDALLVQGVQAALDLSRALRLLLGLGDIDVEVASGILDGLAVQLSQSLLGGLVGGHVDKAEALGLALLVFGDEQRSHLTEGSEQLLQLGLVPAGGELLHVQVGPLIDASTLLSLDEETHSDLHVVDQSAVELGDGLLSSLNGLEVHIAVTFGRTILVVSNLAGENVSKDRESVVQTLVIHRGGQVSHEHISRTRLAERRVSLRPHDSARSVLDVTEVHSVQGALSILNIVKVDISISEGSASHGVSANTDRSHRANTVEELEQKTLTIKTN